MSFFNRLFDFFTFCPVNVKLVYEAHESVAVKTLFSYPVVGSLLSANPNTFSMLTANTRMNKK